MRKRNYINKKIHAIVNESVKNVLNEVSWQLSDRASQVADERDFTDDVIRKLGDIEDWLQQYNNSGDTQASQLLSCVYKLANFARRKQNQNKNFKDLHDFNFKRQHNDTSEHDFSDNMENSNEEDWTPLQREYADFKWY